MAKVGYKQTAAMTAKGEIARKPVFASLPAVKITESDVVANAAALVAHVQRLMEDGQDQIIRTAYEADRCGVEDEEISLSAVLRFLEEQASLETGRLTKEVVAGWVESSGFADALRLRFAELFGISEQPTPEQEAKVEAQVKSYKDNIAALSGSKTYYDQPIAQKLIRAFDVALGFGVDDRMSKILRGRLEVMANQPKDAEMLGL
jgi:hypothetical protein